MRGEGGVAGSQPMSIAVHRSPNKLWRSNSILILSSPPTNFFSTLWLCFFWFLQYFIAFIPADILSTLRLCYRLYSFTASWCPPYTMRLCYQLICAFFATLLTKSSRCDSGFLLSSSVIYFAVHALPTHILLKGVGERRNLFHEL
jgi:hypothetical protein